MGVRVRFARSLLGALTLGMLSSRPAYADAVGPAPTNCPPGSTPEASHAGPYCAPAECPPEGCPKGTQCAPVKACVGSKAGYSNGGPITVSDVKGPCGVGDSCAEGTCQTWNACLKSSSSSSCGCELGPVPMAPGASLALLVAVAFVSSRRRGARKNALVMTWFGVGLPLSLLLAVTACGGQSTSDASGGSANAGGAAGAGGTSGGTGGAGGTGGGAGVAACPVAPPDVEACVKVPYGPPIDLSLSGPVLSTGPVQGSGECLAAPHAPDSYFVEMADAAGTTWHVELSLPGFENTLVAGQIIALDAHYQAPEFGPTVASATLRDESGKLIVYVGEGGDIADLALPNGIALARGASLCTQDDGCGPWSAYDLVVSAGGAQTTLHYGTSETVASWLVTHGGYELAVGGGAHGCFDWFKSHLAVGVVPSP